MWVAVGVVALMSRVQGQTPPQIPDDPSVRGQWAGPFDLADQINENYGCGEITHAVVLPPPNDSWVLLWCLRGCSTNEPPCAAPSYPTTFETYLWHPRAPWKVHTLPLPAQLPYEGNTDLFCSGHVISSSGEVVVFGGTDAYYGCEVQCEVTYGHEAVWIFDNAAIDVASGQFPTWRRATTGGSDMAHKRWYPTAIEIFNGDVMVFGHQSSPVGSPDSTTTYEQGRLIDLTTFDWDEPGLAPYQVGDAFLNRTFVNGCADTALYQIGGYRRIFQLASGQVMCLADAPPGPPAPVSTTAFYDFSATCVEPDAQRWLPGAFDLPVASGAGDIVEIPQAYGSPAVLLVDDSGPSTTEVVYSFGGAPADTACTTHITNAVLRMEDPNPTKSWSRTTASGASLDLPDGRLDSNAVVLLDGSILVVGGFGFDPAINDCTDQIFPLRWRPEEIFRTGVTDTWKTMDAQSDFRRYHSVAGLLPDGRVFSSGGRDDPPGPSVAYNMEVFSPPYMFQGERPTILGVSSVVLTYGGTFDVTVDLPHGWDDVTGESRVALVRPGSITHAFDMSQRYVVLGVGPPLPGPGDEYVLPVDAPSAGAVAPPGHYMLTVLDADGIPSDTVWVEVTSQ